MIDFSSVKNVNSSYSGVFQTNIAHNTFFKLQLNQLCTIFVDKREGVKPVNRHWKKPLSGPPVRRRFLATRGRPRGRAVFDPYRTSATLPEVTIQN